MLDQASVPRVVVAGASSGSGKTTVALGLTAALARRGRAVQTFKVGPDQFDSAYLAHVSGRPCRNLDTWVLGEDGVRRALAGGTTGTDRAVIEGAGGVFDSHGSKASDGDRPPRFGGSTAEVASSVRAPVILVLDVGSVGETAAAVALGVRALDPELRLCGVVLNRVRSDHHRRRVEDAVWELATLPVLGALPSIEEIGIPQRATGLLPIAENPGVDRALHELARAMERHCDLDLVERLMAGAEPVHAPNGRSATAVQSEVRVGVAYDDAIWLYYPENLELIQAAGAEIVPFSPLEDRRLPEDLDGLYLGGGFSEVFAPRLAANRSILDALRRAQAMGMPVYAESGGLLLLARRVRTADGTEHEMAGVIPVDMALDADVRSGYRELRLARDNLLAPAGTRLRGHELHVSRLVGGPGARLEPAYSTYDLDGEPLGCEGWVSGGLLASTVHLHFGQDPRLAARMVARMAAHRADRQRVLA